MTEGEEDEEEEVCAKMQWKDSVNSLHETEGISTEGLRGVSNVSILDTARRIISNDVHVTTETSKMETD